MTPSEFGCGGASERDSEDESNARAFFFFVGDRDFKDVRPCVALPWSLEFIEERNSEQLMMVLLHRGINGVKSSWLRRESAQSPTSLENGMRHGYGSNTLMLSPAQKRTCAPSGHFSPGVETRTRVHAR